MDFYGFVWGNLWNFLWEVIHAAGGGDSGADSAYGWLSSFQGTFWEGVVVALLVPPIALWSLVHNLVGDIHSALDWINWFIRVVVAPIWGWLVGEVQQLAAVVGNLSNIVASIAHQVFDGIIGQIWNAIFWAQQQIDALSQTLASDVQGVINWATTQFNALTQIVSQDVQNVINWATTQFNALTQIVSQDVQSVINWATTQFNALTQIVSQDVQNVINWATTQFNALTQTVATVQQNVEIWAQGFVNGAIANLTAELKPLLDFLTWWQNVGSRVLVEFVNDPTSFILNVIADAFLPWVLDVIERNW